MHDDVTPELHKKHRTRVKERFLKEGLSSFADHEVLELLLFYAIPQGDVNPVAHKLIDEFKSPSAVFNASVEELCKVDGIGEHSAILIKMIPELSKFYNALSTREKKFIETTFDAGEYVCKKIGAEKKEVFAVICLDSQRKVLAFEILEEGTVAQATIHPRKVVNLVVKHNASAVILAHNHPSAGAYASENDRILTNRLCTVLEGMDVHVLDHIIAASPEKFVSMADSGLMPN
ncbi:MAG: DNA repair protein RadC [Ruminococcaceae bacterium]|nr:DNA repair protein RadC [Oscillospiraceae bacterium]